MFRLVICELNLQHKLPKVFVGFFLKTCFIYLFYYFYFQHHRQWVQLEHFEYKMELYYEIFPDLQCPKTAACITADFQPESLRKNLFLLLAILRFFYLMLITKWVISHSWDYWWFSNCGITQEYHFYFCFYADRGLKWSHVWCCYINWWIP